MEEVPCATRHRERSNLTNDIQDIFTCASDEPVYNIELRFTSIAHNEASLYFIIYLINKIGLL